MSTLTLQHVRVDTGGPDEEGRLVFVAERLVAVLVRLSNQHGGTAGQWFLEHGFGRLDDLVQPTFADLGTAQRWIEEHLAEQNPMRVTGSVDGCTEGSKR